MDQDQDLWCSSCSSCDDAGPLCSSLYAATQHLIGLLHLDWAELHSFKDIFHEEEMHSNGLQMLYLDLVQIAYFHYCT